MYGYKINIKGATPETTAHSTSIMIQIVLEIKIYYKGWINKWNENEMKLKCYIKATRSIQQWKGANCWYGRDVGVRDFW